MKTNRLDSISSRTIAPAPRRRICSWFSWNHDGKYGKTGAKLCFWATLTRWVLALGGPNSRQKNNLMQFGSSKCRSRSRKTPKPYIIREPELRCKSRHVKTLLPQVNLTKSPYFCWFIFQIVAIHFHPGKMLINPMNLCILLIVPILLQTYFSRLPRKHMSFGQAFNVLQRFMTREPPHSANLGKVLLTWHREDLMDCPVPTPHP